MGCDIHAYLEVRRYRNGDKERKDGTWVNADKWMIDQYACLYPDETSEKWNVADPIFDDRYYYFFAMLAGVRNSWGVVPVSPPKGFPEDASQLVKDGYKHWDVDGHSHSWLTLRELRDYSWDDLAHKSDITNALTRMEAMCRDHIYPEYAIGADDVRVVFWFDN